MEKIIAIDIAIKAMVFMEVLILLLAVVNNYRAMKKWQEFEEEMDNRADDIENKIDSMWFDLEK